MRLQTSHTPHPATYVRAWYLHWKEWTGDGWKRCSDRLMLTPAAAAKFDANALVRERTDAAFVDVVFEPEIPLTQDAL